MQAKEILDYHRRKVFLILPLHHHHEDAAFGRPFYFFVCPPV